MTCKPDPRRRHRTTCIRSTIGAALALALWMTGCETAGPDGGDTGSLFQTSKQRYTIRCFESRAPNHQQIAGQMAEMLARVESLDRSAVRLESGPEASVVFYGTYTKEPAGGGQWRFSDRFQRDVETIRKVTINQATPFLYAVPEVVDKEQPDGRTPWSITQAAGPYTLQIATFYDTPTFSGRIGAANQYVAGLRDEGFDAYVYHGDLESVVFVGDFNDSDIIQSAQGPQMGPRVHKLIARKPEEFQYVTENGFRRKIMGPTGQMEPIPSFLVEVPDEETLRNAR